MKKREGTGSRSAIRTAKRLFVTDSFSPSCIVTLDEQKSHYLLHVLRMRAGEPILLFNGRDGEWQGKLLEQSRKSCSLQVLQLVREQPESGDLWYLFAPVKQARLDYLVQKATEMGVSRICPVITDFTNVERLNLDRMRANVIEAAQQCGILTPPAVDIPRNLFSCIDSWDVSRQLIMCDENQPVADPIKCLQKVPRGPLAVLVGPEGGFSVEERESLLGCSFVTALSLGSRILRADTAAVAALSLVQATLGDLYAR